MKPVEQHYAVIGNPIAHSLSPYIHTYFAQGLSIPLRYERYLVTSDFERHVINFFKQGGAGLNITAPYKKKAFLLANKASKHANMTQTANTLWFEHDQIYADNTDGAGFIRSLPLVTGTKPRVLILGVGGAAQSIIPFLKPHVLSMTLACRSEQQGKDLAKLFNLAMISPHTAPQAPFDWIINTTGLIVPNTLVTPTHLHENTFCYDLSYATQAHQTPFLVWATTQGVQHIQDGFPMLVYQAALSFQQWHAQTPRSIDIQTLIKAYYTP